MAPTLQLRATAWLLAHTTSPKGKKIFLGQDWPQPMGASDSFRSQNFSPGLSWLVLQPWTCCSLVCAQPESPRLCTSLQVSPDYGWELPVQDRGPHPGWGRSYQTVLCLLCLLLCFRHLVQGIFPSACKISYGMVKSLLWTPWLQEFILVNIHWLFRSLVGRLVENLHWRHEQVDSASTYSAAIIKIFNTVFLILAILIEASSGFNLNFPND